MSGIIPEITKDSFDEKVLHSEGTVMIEFYADWCGPCKMMLPLLEALAESYADKIKVFKMDVESIGTLTKQLGIGSIPAILFFKEGKVVLSKFGMRSKQDLEKEMLGVINNG